MPASSHPTPSPAPDPSHGHLSSLLVGYDDSDGAQAAAAFALWLTGKLDARATLVHACPPQDPGAAAELLPAAAEHLVAYRAEWQRRLENLRDYGATGAAVECRLPRGNPARALVEEAERTAADLLLMGSHGVGALRRALLGSVSAQVLAHAPCSVMIFRERVTGPPASHARSVVVGVDGSPASLRALELAEAVAVPLGAALVLVHAVDPHAPFVSEPPKAMRQAILHHGWDVLHEARSRVVAPLDLVEEELAEGAARDALVAACERRAPALLVVGHRGLGGFRELLVGSTSRWVANCAPCPVLVAREPAA